MSDTIIVYENGKAVGGEGHPTNADEITFDNTGTDLVSEEVESAIKEVNAKLVAKADKTDIAPVESSSTASASHATGSQFYFNGQLVTATANINAGGTIVLNGNCVLSNSIVEQIQIVMVVDNVTTGSYGETTIDNTKLTATMTPIIAYSSVPNVTIHLIYSADNQSWRIWAEKIDGTPYSNANFDVYIKAFKAR